MKYLVIASLALAMFTPAIANAENGPTGHSAVPASPSARTVQPVENVVIAPPRSLQNWQASVSRDLSAHMQYPRFFGPMVTDSDFVVVRFQCGSDGRPSDMSLTRKSRNSRFNSAALRAVSAIRTLHPLPEGMAEGLVIQANLVFATNEQELAWQYARLRQSERTRMAALPKADNAVALNLVAVRTPG